LIKHAAAIVMLLWMNCKVGMDKKRLEAQKKANNACYENVKMVNSVTA